jgi:hypothetical protein
MRKFALVVTLFVVVPGSFLASAFAADNEAPVIEVHADRVLHRISRFLTGACIEDVNHEIYGGIDSQMIFGEAFQEPAPLPAIKGFTRYSGQWIADPGNDGVSGAWKGVHRGTAQGGFALDTNTTFAGRQSQQIHFESGEGEIGIENQGLNRWGMSLDRGKAYDGFVWARSPKVTSFVVAFESGDGSKNYANKKLTLSTAAWERVKFSLTPSASDPAARFAIKLEKPGTLELGYAFVEPGNWGRFKGLPDRKDVVQGLLNQGVTVLRYGGSMVNAPEYRWKKMIGPRDRRPPYRGFWHPDSSNGWGIIDFLNLCEAAGFLGVPDFNMDETPQDMADFIEYVNGPTNSEWGRKRAADGHPAPYRLSHVELGNEERVDETCWRKIKALAEAIWAKDSSVIPVVGDFAYNREIRDPFDFTGSDSRITTLAAHQKILELAKQHNCEVWFDVHLNTEGPARSSSVAALPSYVKAIDNIAAGAKHRVVVFELNANNHQQRRALSNAQAIMLAERLDLPVVTSANGLQPDGQNDNGWNQGLLFLNPSQVWLQPPGYVTQMISRNYEPLLVSSDVRNVPGGVEAAALRSDDGKTLIVQVVNFNADPCEAKLVLDHFSPSRETFKYEQLAGPLNAENIAGSPDQIQPARGEQPLRANQGSVICDFPAHSFSVLRFE